MMLRDPNLLRSLLALKGLRKNTQIARALYLHPNTVGRLFGRYPCHRTTAERIAQFVSVPVEELFAQDGAQ